MKIKTKEQYKTFVKEKLRISTRREAWPLGRKNKTKSGKKKEAITL